jgi:hypothetical protein
MPDIESSNLQVPAELADAGPHIRTVSANLASELDILQKKLAPLAQTWTGNAYQYFTGLQQEWNLASLGLWGDGSQGNMGLLPFIAHALDVSFENYMNAEHANMTTWRR